MASTVQKVYRNAQLSNTVILVATGLQSLVGWNLFNIGASNAFVKLYDAASAAGVNLVTDTPKDTLMVPASGLFFLSNEDKYQLDFTLGLCVVATLSSLDGTSDAPVSPVYCKLLYETQITSNSNLDR
ncbi:MAG TPA: hypothetical protein PK289_00060 [Bacteroidia bacterium]|nr:hypothetical protein [Bacteroidia bacterium]